MFHVGGTSPQRIGVRRMVDRYLLFIEFMLRCPGEAPIARSIQVRWFHAAHEDAPGSVSAEPRCPAGQQDILAATLVRIDQHRGAILEALGRDGRLGHVVRVQGQVAGVRTWGMEGEGAAWNWGGGTGWWVGRWVAAGFRRGPGATVPSTAKGKDEQAQEEPLFYLFIHIIIQIENN